MVRTRLIQFGLATIILGLVTAVRVKINLSGMLLLVKTTPWTTLGNNFSWTQPLSFKTSCSTFQVGSKTKTGWSCKGTKSTSASWLQSSSNSISFSFNSSWTSKVSWTVWWITIPKLVSKIATITTIVIIQFSTIHRLEVMVISNISKIMINKTTTFLSLTLAETTWEVESVFHSLRRNSRAVINKIRSCTRKTTIRGANLPIEVTLC